MGYVEDAIHSYIERSLKREFPPREGWEIKRRPGENTHVPDYFIQKKRFGRTRRVLVVVALAPAVTTEHVTHLRKYAEKMETLILPIERLVILVPTDADTGAVPDDIDVLYLDVLRVEGKDIVWGKRHGTEDRGRIPGTISDVESGRSSGSDE
jgi:hypothetical protein